MNSRQALFSAILLTFTMPACTPVPVGGSGSTQRGEAIAGEILVDPLGAAHELFIRSPKGWQCRSVFASSKGIAKSANKTIPLECNNGATGTALLSSNRFGNQISVAFSLSNGENGSIVIGVA